MATFAFSGRTRERRERDRASASATRWTRSSRRCAASRSRSRASSRRRPRPARSAQARKLKAKSVPAKNLAVFTRQFSVMIDAGLPLVQCLDILGNQEEHKYFAQVILQTRTDVEGGMSLAEAMKRHPKVFDALFCNMIAAGEAGGILDTILKRLATYIEKAVKLKSQVQVGDDLSDRRHRHRRRRDRRDPVEGHPDVRIAVRRPRRRAAAADAHRHRAQRQPGALHAVHHRRRLRRSAGRSRTYYATEKGRRVDRPRSR